MRQTIAYVRFDGLQRADERQTIVYVLVEAHRGLSEAVGERQEPSRSIRSCQGVPGGCQRVSGAVDGSRELSGALQLDQGRFGNA